MEWRAEIVLAAGETGEIGAASGPGTWCVTGRVLENVSGVAVIPASVRRGAPEAEVAPEA